MRTGSIGDDAGAKRGADLGIFHDYVEGVVDGGSFALPKGGGINRLRLSEQHQRTVDQVRTEVPKDASSGEVRLLAPGVRLGVKAETIEPRLIFHHPTQRSRCDQLLDSEECAIPAAILIDGEQTGRSSWNGD